MLTGSGDKYTDIILASIFRGVIYSLDFTAFRFSPIEFCLIGLVPPCGRNGTLFTNEVQ